MYMVINKLQQMNLQLSCGSTHAPSVSCHSFMPSGFALASLIEHTIQLSIDLKEVMKANSFGSAHQIQQHWLRNWEIPCENWSKNSAKHCLEKIPWLLVDWCYLKEIRIFFD